jgi:hypothetical protein
LLRWAEGTEIVAQLAREEKDPKRAKELWNVLA